MICPVDKSDMIVVQYKDIELEYCTDCHGVWFDVGEMELLFHKMNEHTGLSMASILNSPDARTEENPRKCPICSSRMKKALVGDGSRVMIDVCPRSHGIWFDGGELDEMVSNISKRADGTGKLQNQVFNFMGEVFQARKQPDNK